MLGKKNKMETDIVLGEKYRDDQTGVEGIATAVHFYQYACERVTIEYLKPDKDVAELTFDAPRLRSVKTNEVAQVTKTGGPARPGERRGVPGR